MRGGKKDVKEKICISKNTQKEKKYAKEKIKEDKGSGSSSFKELRGRAN